MNEIINEENINVETGAKEEIGIVDEPLAMRGKDLLKIKRYSNALIKFIKSSQTPITIGIQGEWGSGKTSLLNTIYTELETANEHQESKDFKVVWINSWENSLMATPEEALIKIINEIIASLIEVDPKLSNITKVKDAATVAAKGILRVGAGILGGVAGGNVMDEVLQSSNSIRELRLQLTNLVDEIRKSGNQRVDKIVIFVDDLDRIDPPEAVKILELLKNIFSIPGCVFVLAIDYQVVIKGLKEKFGERTPENEWEFRAFFDKIIQLPFLMPMGSYDIGHYVNDLLRQIGFQDENEIDGEFVTSVVNYTIGGNPRSIKRLINSLALIKIFNDSADDEDSDDEEIISNDVMTERQLQFALVCLQIASSDVYSLLSANPDFEKWDNDLAFSYTQKKEEQDPKFAENFELLTKEELFDEEWEKSLYRICYANPRERAKATDLSRFFNFLNSNLGEKCDLPQSIALALGQTSVTSVVSTDDVQRAPKGSYKRNYATGFDGWIEEITIRNDGISPHKSFIDATKSIIDVWQGPEFNAVDWKQGDTPEGYNIRYAGSAALYYSTKKLGNIWIRDHKKGKDAKLQINVLKNPVWKNQIIHVGGINFNHHRPVSIDKEEKKVLKGGAGFVEWMWADVHNLEMLNDDIVSLLFAAAMKTRTELWKDMVTAKQVSAHIKAFKENRKDSKVWAEAAEFLENYFKEDNRVDISINA
jgi:GTPase SAR1 family protein